MKQAAIGTYAETATKSAYLNLLFLGLFVNIITAFFSVGYHHPDEHFQVLEFAGYKLGNSTLSEIPWEYSAKCRAGLLPFITFCLAKFLSILHLYDPFAIALILRLVMVACTWYVTVLLTREFLPEFTTRTGGLLYVGSSLLLWFVPYLNVRFSSENVAQLCFFLAVLQIYRSLVRKAGNSSWQLLAAGFLLGISFFIRLQMGFALVGLGIWMLFVQKAKWHYWLSLFVGGFIAIGMCVLIDHWLYGVWTFSPYNYFAVNILQDKASEFGVSPWWEYFTYFTLAALPPISIILLVAFFAGIGKTLRHPFSLLTITFIAGHMFVAHKELRFIFPMLPAFIFLACMGIDGWLRRYEDKRLFRIVGGFAIGVNFVMLLFRCVMPAYDAVSYYSFIYSYAKKHRTQFVSQERSPYNTIDLEANFYKPRGLRSLTVQQAADLTAIVDDDKNESVLYLSRGLQTPNVKGLQFKRLFCIFPSWLMEFNPNNWQERANIWVIYGVEQSGTVKGHS
ncbi:hypothetical protein [Polluticoccus soli]|uniref:hypothetical protein n=1 Tax=Polluticoccus soli TaxID=3034150 RepID=UPI0023E21E09|nr:hypothetical protein [Flavipsychrobacter sp. JY13-12]